MEKPLLVIYHGQCRDGWCAAWVAKKKYPDAELVPAMYGKEPPDVTGRKVLMVDFCYPRATIETMAEVASVRILDHHKTAQAALEGLAGTGKYPLVITFDMARSGAGITWDELFAGEPRPWLVDYVEDRDIWTWKLPYSRKVNAFLSTLPYGKPEDFLAWDLASRLPISDVITAGEIALASVQRYVENVCENALVRTVDGFIVPSINAPQHEISEVLEHLQNLNPEAPFVHGWWQRADGLFANSLRSRGEFDVSEIAKQRGGGGHKMAAGFQVAVMSSVL